MTRFVIHIGPHKTGSTYLQYKLMAGRTRLAALGVLIPSIWSDMPHLPGHHGIYRRVRKRELDLLRREFQDLKAPEDGIVVVSSESLKDLTREEVALFAAALPAGQVKVVYYCRRWSELLPSAWQENVKQGMDQTLPMFLDQRTRTIRQSLLFNYGIVVDRYMSAFGEKNVALVSYSNLADEGLDLARHFVSAFLPGRAGQVEPDDWAVSSSRPNASMGAVETEIVRVLNETHRRRGGEPGGAIREWYLREGQDLSSGELAAAMNGSLAEEEISDAAQGRDALHTWLYARYGRSMVPPLSAGGLFTPRRNLYRVVSGDYLAVAGMGGLVEDAYRRFLSPQKSC